MKEYKVIRANTDLEAQLNSAGAEGWELRFALATTSPTYILERDVVTTPWTGPERRRWTGPERRRQ